MDDVEACSSAMETSKPRVKALYFFGFYQLQLGKACMNDGTVSCRVLLLI